MKRKILVLSLLFILIAIAFLGVRQTKAANDDYFEYSTFDPDWSTPYGIACAGGYVADYGDPHVWGDEEQYVYFFDNTTAYKVRVWLTDFGPTDPLSPGWIEPHQHPNNPDTTGPIEPRHFEVVSSANLNTTTLPPYVGGSSWHTEEFHVDASGVYVGAYPYGIHKWDHDWNYVEQIAEAPEERTETLAYNPHDNVWYAGNRSVDETHRAVYELRDTDNDGSFLDESWVHIFSYPALGVSEGEHHDGMEYAGGYLWISDMFSDAIAQWYYDAAAGQWLEKNRFTYTEAAFVEGMGFGPNDHFWVTSGLFVEADGIEPDPESAHLYELGGGKLIPPKPAPVGGVWVPINKSELLAPWIGLVSLITVVATSVVYVKHNKKSQN